MITVGLHNIIIHGGDENMSQYLQCDYAVTTVYFMLKFYSVIQLKLLHVTGNGKNANSKLDFCNNSVDRTVHGLGRYFSY